VRKSGLAIAGTLIATVLSATAVARNPTPQERTDIENLAYRYIFALDWRDPQAYAATFAPDGVLTYGGGEAKGREAIAKMVQGMRDREMANLKPGETGQGSAHAQHFVTSMVIDVSKDGRTAVAQAYWMMVRGAEPRIAAYGHYVDRLAKIKGEWLYTARRTVNEQTRGRETLPFVNPVTNPEKYGAQLESR
jgi:ketosteroid isomerase-like protein